MSLILGMANLSIDDFEITKVERCARNHQADWYRRGHGELLPK